MTASQQFRHHISERAEPPRPVVCVVLPFRVSWDRLSRQVDSVHSRSRALLADALLSVRLHAHKHGDNRCDSRSPRTPEQFGDRNRLSQRFEVPRFVEPLLRGISDELCRVMFNKNQAEYNSPFDNTGESYRNEVFEVHAYSWSDDEQPYNFKWGDLKISWYKYLGRGMSANKEISPDYAVQMFDACIASVRAEDTDWGSQ